MTMQYLCMLIGHFYFKYRQSKFIEKLIRFVVFRIKDWMEGMLAEYGKLAAWRIWVSQKFKELESSMLEPDWNIVYSMIREMEANAKKIFTSSDDDDKH